MTFTLQGGASLVEPFSYKRFTFVLLYCLVCSWQPCDYLLAKDWPLGSRVCDISLCFVTFPYGVLGQVRYLIVLITDILLLLYFCPWDAS